jgi:hypothetical protein
LLSIGHAAHCVVKCAIGCTSLNTMAQTKHHYYLVVVPECNTCCVVLYQMCRDCSNALGILLHVPPHLACSGLLRLLHSQYNAITIASHTRMLCMSNTMLVCIMHGQHLLCCNPELQHKATTHHCELCYVKMVMMLIQQLSHLATAVHHPTGPQKQQWPQTERLQ